MNPIDCCKKAWEQCGHILAAVSGGADSVALVLALHETKGGRQMLSAVHLNHHLRGAESDSDEKFVKELCQRLEVPLYCHSADIKKRAESQKVSVEVAARDARYELFEKTADECGADLIATAHTSDDNAETVLLNLIRGTGITGLSGIPDRRGRIIRPLIECSRHEILAYLSLKGQDYVTDSSNNTDDYRRNRVRHNIMPLILKENPSAIEAILRCTKALKEDASLLNKLALELYRESLISTEPMAFSLKKLRAAPKPLVLRLLQQACEADVSSERLVKVYELITSGNASCRQQIKENFFAYLSYDSVIFGAPPCQDKNYLEKKLQIGDNIFLKNMIRLEMAAAGEINNELIKDHIDCDKITGNLIVRTRREGDRTSPVKGVGSRSLKRLYIDRKVPARLREELPVIADADGIVWTAVSGADRRCAAAEGAKCILKIEWIGGKEQNE